MKIELEISEKNEGTSAPWWAIIDPRQNFATGNRGLYNIANLITGPFFSREAAEMFLHRTRYNFGKNANVFCMTGCYSHEYSNAIKEAETKCGRMMGDK